MLHAAVVAATLFSWQHRLEVADLSPPVVPVDLVTVGEKTNIAPTVQKIVTPHQETPAPPPAQPTPAPSPTPPPKAEAAPQPLPTPQAKPAPPLRPAAKPTPTPAPTKSKTDAFADLLNNLTKPAAAPRNARVADRTVKGIGAMNAATMDLQDALRNAISQCWSPPVGAPQPDQLIVYFEIFLNPDGSVARPPQLAANSVSAVAADPYMRAAAEAARRAIYTCAPYKLPADKYATWRDFTIDFNPSKMAQ
jgi:outer membrane biosynthesis protein TonB